jgi:hypothetical protein
MFLGPDHPVLPKAMRISPVPDFICLRGLVAPTVCCDRYDDAEATPRTAPAVFPDHLVGHMGLVNVYVETGRMEEANRGGEVLRSTTVFRGPIQQNVAFQGTGEVDRLVDALRRLDSSEMRFLS